jgi:ADP-glucose pyrophosphorylase
VAASPSTGDAPSFGIMRTAADGRITEFAEKPSDPAVLDSSPCRRPLHGVDGLRLRLRRSWLLADHADKTDFGRDLIPISIRNYR